MKYDRDWTLVEDELAVLWINAPDRQEVTEAANQMDRLLSNYPLAVGESRDGNTRILFEAPLAILFDVIEDDRRVLIWQIWRWGR